ncbi:hypothetical protein ACR78T_22930, partial [Sphingobacterium spiritivorum]
VLSYNAQTNTLTYKDEKGLTNTIDISTLVKNNETLTTLAYNNSTKILTYTDEKGVPTPIDISTLVTGNETLTVLSYNAQTNTLTYKDEKGLTNTIDISTLVKNNETLTKLAYDNTNKILTYTDEKGLDTPIDISALVTGNETLTVLSYDPVNNKLIYKDEKGDENSLDISTLVKNNQTTTTVVAGTATSVTFSTVGNNTAYTINVNPATTTSTGAVKPGSGLSVAADGTLSVNTSGTGGIGKDFTSTDLNITNGTGATLTDVVADIKTNAVTTIKIADANVTAAKLNAGTGTTGRVAIADATGAVTYGKLPASSVTGENFTSTDLNITGGTGATLTTVTANINDGVITPSKLANAGNNQVLITDGTGLPQWVNQNTLVPATTNTLVNNGTNTLTSTVDGVTATAQVVNTVANSLSGSNLTTTVNGVPATALDLAPAVQNALKFANGTNATLTGNGTIATPYKYDVATANGTTLGVVKEAATDPTVNIVNGELSVNPANVATSLGKDVTAGSTKVILSGTPTGAVLKPFSIDVATANGTSLGVVKEATTNPTVNIINGELAVNPVNVATSLGKTITTDGIIKVNAVNALAGSVLVDAVLSIADGSITSTKITDGTIVNADIANSTITEGKIANAGANQVLTTSATGVPQWVNQNTLEPWRVQGTSNGATTNAQNIYQMGNVAIGAGATALTGVDASSKLFVNGTITTASSLYADYVFEDYLEGTSKLNSDYSFKSLDEVETFINENKHLPGVTGIKGLNKNEKGEYIFNISELSVQILEKVEELYLHTIEQKKQLDNKDREIETLKETVKNMNERIERLEKLYETQPSHTK